MRRRTDKATQTPFSYGRNTDRLLLGRTHIHTDHYIDFRCAIRCDCVLVGCQPLASLRKIYSSPLKSDSGSGSGRSNNSSHSPSKLAGGVLSPI